MEANQTPSPPAPPRRSLARNAGLVGGATLVSRLLGLVREQIFAALVGATAYADAFVVAFRIPNLLRDLFAEGALSAAFVPTFTDYLVNRSKAEAILLANRLINLVSVVISLVLLVAFVFAVPLVHAMAPGFDPTKAVLTAHLTRLMLPFLLLLSIAAISGGMLTSQHHFLETSLAPSAFNVVSILVGAGLYFAGVGPRAAVVGWAIATVLGGFMQMAVHGPPLWREGFRYRPILRGSLADPGVRRILALMAPSTLGLAGTQLNLFFNTVYASKEAGAPAFLSYAFRLIQLPIGLFGVAIATVAASSLAHRAASRDLVGLRDELSRGLRLVLFLTLPATTGLYAVALPTIRLLYQHGRFTPADTVAVATSLRMYALGIFAFAAVKVIAPAFYALEKPRVAVVASLISVAANIVVNGISYLTQPTETLHKWLPLGTAVTGLVNVVLLLAFFRGVGGSLDWRRLGAGFAKMSLAAALCGVAALSAVAPLEHVFGVRSLLARVATAFGPILLGALVYAAVSALLHVEEIDAFRAALARRLRRR